MHFLIVEDDPLTATILAKSIIVAHHSVTIVQTLTEAMISAQSIGPSAIILDLNLSDSSAENTVEGIPDLQTASKGAAIAVLTGCLTDALRERSEALGASYVAEKKSGVNNAYEVAMEAIRNKCDMKGILCAAEEILGQKV